MPACRLRSLVALALVVVALVAGIIPTSGPAPAGAVGTCERDTAADLRWVSWIHRAHTGTDPSLPLAARWLADIEIGDPYERVARTVGSTDAASAAAVRRLYVQLLQRTPSEAEVAGWVPTARTRGSAAVAVAFLASNETYQRGGATDAGWLDRVYRLVLGRGPDGAGMRYWLDRLAAGATPAEVSAALWATPASLTRRVDAAYRLMLGRPGDPGGIAHWSALAAARGDETVLAALAANPAAWALAQRTYGGPAVPMPPPCPPRLRWVPAPGTIVRDLRALAHRGPRLAALTFDDGPSPVWTPQVLDVLARKDVAATFFVVGNQARAHPDLVRRTLAEGHHLAVHTMSHPVLPSLGADAQRREIGGSVAVVDDIVGPGHVRCFRPPYGSHNATTDRIAAELGLATILWSRDGRDWASPGIEAIVADNLDTRYDGGRAVLLLHDGGMQRAQTVAALPRLIDELRGRGYEFVQIC